MENIKLMLPVGEVKSFEKIIKRAAKNIEGIEWTMGKPYNKTFIHLVDGLRERWSHTIVDVEIVMPTVNDWVLLATVVEGALFVTNPKEKIIFRDGHGVEYKKCDACGRPQWKKSFIVRNAKTDEELQVGSECAKKFGIGTVNAIYNLTRELYENYSFCFDCGDDFEDRMWSARYHDPHAVKSIETSIVVQAAKKYYDNNKCVWKKGRYIGREYYPSESAAEIKGSLNNFVADEDNEYYKSLCDWLNNVFEAGEYNEFEENMKNVGSNYYMSVGDVAAAFFAIKRFELYKKEKEAREKGIYLPKRNDYIHIVGKIVDKVKKEGYFGSYVEYTILNNLDGNTYKRAGVVKSDDENNVDCYAFIKDVYKGNYTLDRTTIKPKKGIAIDNVF